MNEFAASLAFSRWRERDAELVELFAHNLAEGEAPQSAYEAAFAKRYGFTLTDQASLLELIDLVSDDDELSHLAQGARAVLFSTKRGGTSLPTPGVAAQHMAVSVVDPRAQEGKVFDVLHSVDGTVFTRVGSAHEPAHAVTAFRVQFQQPLTEDEQWTALRAAKYVWSRNIRASDPIVDMVSDSPCSLIFVADPSTSKRSNVKSVLENFPEDVMMVFREGSPERVSDTQFGPAGTRQVEQLPPAATASMAFWWGC